MPGFGSIESVVQRFHRKSFFKTWHSLCGSFKITVQIPSHGKGLKYEIFVCVCVCVRVRACARAHVRNKFGRVSTLVQNEMKHEQQDLTYHSVRLHHVQNTAH